MSSQQSSNQQKTKEERRQYIETTVRGVSPTLEDLPPPIGFTDIPSESESKEPIPFQRLNLNHDYIDKSMRNQ